MAEWEETNLEAVLALLPDLEKPGFEFAQWQTFQPDEHGVTQMPYPVYSPTVDRLFELVAGVHPYDPLPEDGSPGGLTIDSRFTPESFAAMTTNQVRRYFTHCRRCERFCDGYIEGQFMNGNLLAALHRLRTIKGSLE